MTKTGIVLIGYSGHAYVACDIFLSGKQKITGYLEKSEKKLNPFRLSYLGTEQDEATLRNLREMKFFIAIGDNAVRKKIFTVLIEKQYNFINAVHAQSCVSILASLGKSVMVGPGAIINSMSLIDDGVICNTGSVVEHECIIGKFSHIAPGAVLGGNVVVGNHTLIGLGAVVRNNIKIGNNVIVGAGAIIVKDIPDNSIVVGNPQRTLYKTSEE